MSGSKKMYLPAGRLVALEADHTPPVAPRARWSYVMTRLELQYQPRETLSRDELTFDSLLDLDRRGRNDRIRQVLELVRRLERGDEVCVESHASGGRAEGVIVEVDELKERRGDQQRCHLHARVSVTRKAGRTLKKTEHSVLRQIQPSS